MWRGGGVGCSGGLGGVSRQGLNKCERGLFWLSENPLCLMTVGEQECGCGAKGCGVAERRRRPGSPGRWGVWAVGRLATLKDQLEKGRGEGKHTRSTTMRDSFLGDVVITDNSSVDKYSEKKTVHPNILKTLNKVIS